MQVEAIAEKVSRARKNLSNDEKENIEHKRKETYLKKYGETNIFKMKDFHNKA